MARPQVLLIAGTKKGLFLFTTRDRKRWTLRGPFLKGKDINHAVRDPHSGRLYATANDAYFGSEIVWTDNLGRTWTSAKRNPSFARKSGWRLDRIWHIEPAPNTDGVLYAGVAPAALFRSEDRGQTWREVTALTKHPTRSRWHPGQGGLCLHSIVLDPHNARQMFVGISAVGVFRTEDGGQTWETANRGTRAEFQPVKYPEYGQCVHKLLAAAGPPLRLYQQNHCGSYRSDDAGRSWREITRGLPSDFGFGLAVHPHDRETIYVVPLQGAEFRCPPAGRLRVFRTRNGGRTWQALTRGLPQRDIFLGLYREGLATDPLDPAGVYFGTNTGKIFGSADEGDSWSLLADNLPPVGSVSVGVLA